MATLFEIAQVIKATVNRPDLEANGLTDIRIIAAVKACHAVSPAIRDFSEIAIPVEDGPALIGKALYDINFRNISTIIGYDVDGNLACELDLHTPTEIVRLRRMNREVKTAYVVDNAISFNSPVELAELVVSGYQQTPPIGIQFDPITNERLAIAEDNQLGQYRDWLLDSYEVAIIDYAVGYIEGLKGNRELANLHLNVFETVHRVELERLAILAAN